ncbi:MAG: type II secretion system protein [Akkermansiaceae bacterium]
MKLSINHKSSKKGFTLIELLVVIAIIATLGGLAYGPIMKHLRSADVLKAQKVCKDLVGGIGLYESEYDHLPFSGGSYPTSDETIITSDGDFLEDLMGIDTTNNDRGKEFFTADQADGDRDGLVYTGTSISKLVDKWSNPYHIRLDYDADGIIDATQIGTDATGKNYPDELRIDEAIVASPGPDKLFDSVSDARSW